MKIIFANKYWYLKGGAERYEFDLAELLSNHGHDIIPFAMRSLKNFPSEWKNFFVSEVQTERVGFGWEGLRTAFRSLWSFEARSKFGALLDETQPSLVHVHNIYRQISPSILGAARKRGLPIVMTVHDYALISPNYSLYHDGAICEVTKPELYSAAVRHRCVKGSYLASALVALEMRLHRRLHAWENVDRFIAPSRFTASLLAAYGVPDEIITHVPHFIDATLWKTSYGTGEYVLFVGRLSEEKGVATLIRAAALIPDIPFHIVGTGPEEERLRALAEELGASNVKFRGWMSGEVLRAEYADARFVVVPSEWYEVFGLIVLEAYAAGKPVIASQIGGLAELVKDGETGLHASAGDEKDLATNIYSLWTDPVAGESMGRAGRAWVEAEFSPEEHYRRIMEVYGSVME